MEKIRVAVSGAAGRMGSRIIALLPEEFRLTGSLEAKGHPAIGTSRFTDDCDAALKDAQVLIDFTSPAATMTHLASAVRHGVGIVIGTTGLTETELEAIDQAAKKIPLLVAPNMSVGINLLCRLLPMITEVLGQADIEIVEAHHNAKKDAPSGTALRLLEVIQKARSGTRTVFGREGREALRDASEIGVHAVRGGDVVGDHTVHFLAQGERIEVTHRASSRDTFALGAIRAAKFISGKPPGRYSMEDVLFGK